MVSPKLHWLITLHRLIPLSAKAGGVAEREGKDKSITRERLSILLIVTYLTVSRTELPHEKLLFVKMGSLVRG